MNCRLKTFPMGRRCDLAHTRSSEEIEGKTQFAASDSLTGAQARGPCPLEIVAAEPAGHVHHLADEVEARHRLRFHGAGIELAGVDAAQRHLGGAVALRPRRLE